MPHKVRAFKSGNSLVVTIPADIKNQLGLRPGSELWVSPIGSRKFLFSTRRSDLIQPTSPFPPKPTS